MEKINVLARVLIIDEGNVLTVKKKGQDWCFIPGGHVEYGEGAVRAIKRECLEEFGGNVEIGGFLGVIEHAFKMKDGLYHEINVIFGGKLVGYDFPDLPNSLEEDLQVMWCSLDMMEENILLPEKIRELVKKYFDKDESVYWSSDMN